MIGPTDSTRNQLRELIDIAKTDWLKVKVWKKLKLDNIKEALQDSSQKIEMAESS